MEDSAKLSGDIAKQYEQEFDLFKAKLKTSNTKIIDQAQKITELEEEIRGLRLVENERDQLLNDNNDLLE